VFTNFIINRQNIIEIDALLNASRTANLSESFHSKFYRLLANIS